MSLKPGVRYLRVTAEGRTAILALGYVDLRPEGAVEVWYSGEGEVIRLLNGHLVGTTGLASDWREVRYSGLPGWEAIGGKALSFRRQHDEMPGYRLNIEDSLVVRAIAPPSDTQLAHLDGRSLHWFEERGGGDGLPSARYGVRIGEGETQAVYGEQCLTKTLCLTWQQWPSGVGAQP